MPRVDKIKIFLRFNSYLIRYWKAGSALLLCGVVSIIFSLFGPYIGKLILDNGILGRDMRSFFIYTLIGGVIYLLRQVSDRGASVLKNSTTRKIKVDLARSVFRKTQKLSLESFRDKSIGGYASRLNADITVCSGVIASTAPELIKAVLRLILITLIIAFINVKILILILCYQVIVIAQARFFARRQEALARAFYKKGWDMSRALTQIFSQIYVIKASGTMAAVVRKYFHIFFDSIRSEAATTKLDSISDALSEISGKLFFGTVGLVGTLLVIKGQMTLGSLGAILAYMSQGTAAYTALVTVFERIVLNRLSLERMAEVLDAPVYVKERSGAPYVKFSRPGINFKNVSFGYRGGNDLVLDRINFTVMPGSKAALVGASGSGKTTIANLILRLYDVNSGGIFLDGCDVREMSLKSIYSQTGLVPQAPSLWSGSIAQAMAWGGRSIDASEVRRAARLAEIDSFIEGLPDGYNTILEDMVSVISQGQRQRMAIAAALAKKPKILIMDEACSSLDSGLEERIVDNIIGAYPGSTLVMISHRLSSARKMDTVYFLKSPSKMDAGTAKAFAESDIKYNELFAGQINGIG